MTKEKGYCEAGAEHKVFDVKGMKMGIAICADGTDRKNLQALLRPYLEEGQDASSPGLPFLQRA